MPEIKVGDVGWMASDRVELMYCTNYNQVQPRALTQLHLSLKKSYSFVMCYSEGLLGPVKQISLDAIKSEMIIG